MRIPGSFLLLIAVLYLQSCAKPALYDEQVKVSEDGWAIDEAARFDLKIPDTTVSYDFQLNIRNSIEYRYSNLFVFLTTHFPNGNITIDTIEFVLADKSGKWLGKGWGNIRENNILLKSGLRFPAGGNYTFLINQAMRTDTLKGIAGIGLRIEFSE